MFQFEGMKLSYLFDNLFKWRFLILQRINEILADVEKLINDLFLFFKSFKKKIVYKGHYFSFMKIDTNLFIKIFYIIKNVIVNEHPHYLNYGIFAPSTTIQYNVSQLKKK